MDSDEEEFLYLSTCTLLLIQLKKRKRRWWQREFLKKRKTHGAYSMLMNELTLEDGSGFKNYCRVSTTEFEDLLQKVAPLITKRDTRLREAIPAPDRLAVTLRFLATGDSFSTLMYLHRMSKSTICNVINTVTAALVKVLAGEVKLPESEEEWLHITKTFERKWNFPHCLGALDGKHIQINAPANSGSEFYNYKGHFSIVLLAATDANYKFIYANAGVQGRISDGGVLKYTSLHDKVSRNALHIPEPQALPGRTVPVPYAFVVDDAFSLETHFLKPYPGNYPPNSWQRIFNYRICRARRIIENAFGILSAVFRVLRTNMTLSPERATNVTLAAVYIHNYLRHRNSTFYTPPGTFDSEDTNGNVVEGEWRSDAHNRLAPLLPVTGRRNAMIDYRREIADYCLSVEGMIPWQYNR